MTKNAEMLVELVYISPPQQYFLSLWVDANTSYQEVIELSGILVECPEIDLQKQKIGVFGKPRSLTDRVMSGDRIEIYRPLKIDPKEMRRVRARS